MTIGNFFRFLGYPPARKAFGEYFRRWKPVLVNLISSDVYTMASAISTCAVISFFPFMILLITIVQNVLQFQSAADLITKLIEAYLPFIGDQPARLAQLIGSRVMGRVQVVSVLIVIASAMGVFIPIEVALNRIWKAPANMSFIKNQIISFGVVLLCGGLSLLSFMIGGLNLWLIRKTLSWFPWAENSLEFVSVKIVGFLLSIALFFVVFSLLPNIRMPFDITARAAVFTGIVWEFGKYAYLWSLKHLDLSEIYGIFTASVVLILWSYVSAMIMILGAELAHRELLSLRLFRPAYEEWKALHVDRNAA